MEVGLNSRYRRVIVVSLIAFFAMSCGTVTQNASGNVASEERSPSAEPSPTLEPSQSPNSSAFQAGDCTDPGIGGTVTQPFTDNFKMVVTIPAGWTREPTPGDETTLAVLDPPSTFANPPTSIRVASLLGYFANLTPVQVAEGISRPGMDAPQPCNVRGDAAAFYHYSDGSRAGYFVLWLHFNYAYALTVEGGGGVDPRAVRDARAVLASVTWTVSTPPQR